MSILSKSRLALAALAFSVAPAALAQDIAVRGETVHTMAGDPITDGVVVIEAMKMEHKLTAPFDAKVETLNAKEGQQVDMNELLAHLVRLEADEE